MKRLAEASLLLLLAGLTVIAFGVANADETDVDALLVGPDWTALTAITTANNNDFFSPVVAVAPDGSELTVAYLGDAVADPYFRRSTDNGSTWTSASKIYITAGESLQLDISYDSSNKAHAVWVDGLNLVFRKGDNWSQPFPGLTTLSLPASAPGASDPSLTASGSNTLDVIWAEAAGGSPDIYHRRSIDGGSNWGSKAPVAVTAPSSVLPSLEVDQSGVLHAVWEESTSLLYAEGTPGSGAAVSWSVPISIMDEGSDDVRRPRITLSGSVLSVSYTRLHGKDAQRETVDMLTCASNCTSPSGWSSAGSPTQFLGIALNNPNDSIVSDITYGSGCTYSYFDGTSSDFAEQNNIIWGFSSCDLTRDRVTEPAVQSNNPKLASHGEWIHLTFEQKTNNVNPDYAHIYYVRGKLPSYVYLPTIVRN